MKKALKYANIAIILVILTGLLAVPALAQNVLTAQVDRSALSTDDMLSLTVTVNANAISTPQPTIPALAGFNMLGTSSSSQISIINGAMSTQVVYTYRLQPNQTGQLTIDPISVTVDGQTYQTDPITVEVSQGTGAPTTLPAQPVNPTAPTSSSFAGQKMFVEAEVSNPNPYLGEQIIYTFRYYRAVDFFDLLDQPNYQSPSFAGFWSEDNKTDQSNYRVQAAGHYYDVIELNTLLFPSKVGEITIEPAHLVIPASFFSTGADLVTDPIMVKVQQLPVDAPASFTGAVGQFELTAAADVTETKVNEPITWQVTLTGQGNLNTLPDPVWPEMDGWRSFESQAVVNTQTQNGVVGGSKSYERLLVPTQPGQFTIPALEYSYFDPQSGEYKTLTTQPIPVTVTPGAGATSYTAAVTGQAGAQPIANDIRPLKPVPEMFEAAGSPITGSPLYWLAWGIPLVGLVGYTTWKRREQYWQNNTGLARSSKAHKKARQALKQAHKQADTYQAAHQILTDYLADKLDQPVAGLTQRALSQLLADNGLNAGLIDRVQLCLSDAELGRYSPDAGQPGHAQNVLKETEILINDLEKEL